MLPQETKSKYDTRASKKTKDTSNESKKLKSVQIVMKQVIT